MALDRITVGRNVDLQQLKQLANDAGDKKIRLKTEGDQTILYVSNKKDTGFKNLFTRQNDKREAKARDLIHKALGFVPPGSGKAAVTGAKLHAVMNRCGDTVSKPTKDGQGTLDVPSSVTFGGKKYLHESHIATKGYGHVHTYKLEGGNERIAVKVLTNKPTEASSEFALQRKAAKEGDAVLDIKGVAVNPTDGTIVVAMPLMLGDGDTAATKLKAMEDQGLISSKVAEAVRMTMIHDMAKGVEQVGDAGIIQFDVKPDNFLIGPDGKMVMIDFGAAQSSDKPNSTEPSKMLHWKQVGKEQQNPAMIAPEIHLQMKSAEVKYDAAEKAILGKLKADFLKKHPELPKDQNMAEIPDADVRKEWRQLRAAALKNPKLTNPTVKLTSSADGWGFGMAVFHLAKGSDANPTFLQGADNNLKINAAMQNFGSDPTNRVITNPTTPTEKMANELMHPDKKQRATAFDVLNSTEMYQTPGVGSPEVREIMKALATGNDAVILQNATLIDNLDAKTDGDRRVEMFKNRRANVMGDALETTGLV